MCLAMATFTGIIYHISPTGRISQQLLLHIWIISSPCRHNQSINAVLAFRGGPAESW